MWRLQLIVGLFFLSILIGVPAISTCLSWSFWLINRFLSTPSVCLPNGGQSAGQARTFLRTISWENLADGYVQNWVHRNKNTPKSKHCGKIMILSKNLGREVNWQAVVFFKINIFKIQNEMGLSICSMDTNNWRSINPQLLNMDVICLCSAGRTAKRKSYRQHQKRTCSIVRGAPIGLIVST